VKYNTMNPTQLPTTPTAEYELVNMSGRNSYLPLKSRLWISDVYRMSGMATAMYRRENRSRRKIRGDGDLRIRITH
jgi:hypothetical protein